MFVSVDSKPNKNVINFVFACCCCKLSELVFMYIVKLGGWADGSMVANEWMGDQKFCS
jgi:hypothetical protein